MPRVRTAPARHIRCRGCGDSRPRLSSGPGVSGRSAASNKHRVSTGAGAPFLARSLREKWAFWPGQAIAPIPTMCAGVRRGRQSVLLGNSWDAHEQQDALTLALLAEKAKYSATVFDLRPVRQLLDRIPAEKGSALERNLVYWADAYGALTFLQPHKKGSRHGRDPLTVGVLCTRWTGDCQAHFRGGWRSLLCRPPSTSLRAGSAGT
jgi:hypothetical protein